MTYFDLNGMELYPVSTMRRHIQFIVLLAVVAVSRFLILFLSQTHVHSDEAIIGLMAKHISEGLYYPFYMYGQPYNACAAWEAYVASVVFMVFGVGVIQLKSCIVVISLATLVLFYQTVTKIYDLRTAWWSSLVLALMPSLLKWDFQVRGYSFYFLAIPVLTGLFFSFEPGNGMRARKFFIFGLASGLSVWCLELILTLVAAFWGLLLLRRMLSVKNTLAGLLGFIIGYLPAMIYNLMYHFKSWHYIFIEKASAPLSVFHPSVVAHTFLVELPKFFGPDTVIWYFPETPLSGWLFYGITMAAIILALAPFLKEPMKVKSTLAPGAINDPEQKDFLILILIAVSFVPYVVTIIHVPTYLVGGCFFFAILIGRLISRCLASTAPLKRGLGVALAVVTVAVGVGVEIQTARHNQIDTLTLDRSGHSYYMERIPGADIEAVQNYLAREQISSTWATLQFVYPLIFETNERLAVSSAVFNFQYQAYPPSVPRRMPPDTCGVFVVETDSPFLPVIEAQATKAAGAPPLVTKFGTMTIVEVGKTETLSR
jgi:4-amino-4-deoxy-L-arabinose transferase-like glycosyltransferase